MYAVKYKELLNEYNRKHYGDSSKTCFEKQNRIRDKSIEYQKLVNRYYDKVSKTYLEKYWIHSDEWENIWKPVKEKIFDINAKDLPDMMFNGNYKLVAQRGGILMCEDDLKTIKRCMNKLGEKFFFIVENINARPLDEYINDPLLFRFKFPSDVSWKDLSGEKFFGGYSLGVSFDLLRVADRNYFVFGESGLWGRYVGSEYWNVNINNYGTPLDITGCEEQCFDIFYNELVSYEDEANNILAWLPDIYRSKTVLPKRILPTVMKKKKVIFGFIKEGNLYLE
jgi:hypothetical protein